MTAASPQDAQVHGQSIALQNNYRIEVVGERFGRYEYRFISHTRGAKTPAISYSEGQFFCSRDLSYPSAQIADFALRKICVTQDLRDAEFAWH